MTATDAQVRVLMRERMRGAIARNASSGPGKVRRTESGAAGGKNASLRFSQLPGGSFKGWWGSGRSSARGAGWTGSV